LLSHGIHAKTAGLQNTKQQGQKKKTVEAAHFQLCGSANYPVVLNILSLDRMAEG
jgi:hypothetical protein